MSFAPCRFALGAGAKLPEVIKGIDAGGMAVAPMNLQGVAAHKLGVLKFQWPGAVHRQRICLPRWWRFVAIRAGCARAAVTKVLVGIRAAVPILPLDDQRVAFAMKFNGFGSQRHFSTL